MKTVWAYRLIAAVVFVAVAGGAQAQVASTSPPPSADPTAQVATPVDDIEVRGSLRSRTEAFTESVAAPANGRGLARWRGPVCLAVVNYQPEIATWLADRIVTAGGEAGVEIREPECAPNVLIVGAVDTDALIEEWVDRRPGHFRTNRAQSGATQSALARFAGSDDPVRWFTVSVPMQYNIMTGRACPVTGRGACDVIVHAKSQMRGLRRDDLQRIVIVVDMERAASVTAEQLADYLTMVAFAQVDPDGETAGFDTILNLFKGDAPDGLSEWDRAYLRGMYDAPDDRRLNGFQQAALLRTALETAADAEPLAVSPPPAATPPEPVQAPRETP